MEDMRPKRCTACGSTALEEGFIYTRAHESDGMGRWVSGAYERNSFSGQPASMRKRRIGQVVAYRCRACSHLEHYVELDDQDDAGW